MKYEKHLKVLRNTLARGNMSALVGAGFSKNVDMSFPTWDELLHDLTYEMYRDEIEQAYRQHVRGSTKRSVAQNSFVKQKCRDILARIGYLEVVSEFIRRKGYPESIVAYIEERTPTISPSKEGFIMRIGDKEIAVSSNQLSLHRKLIELPWNNIYTTNYDQLLDCCVDEAQSDRLRSEIELLEDENLRWYQVRDDAISELSLLPDYDLDRGYIYTKRPVDQTIFRDEEEVHKNERKRAGHEVVKRLAEDQLRENEQAIKQKEIALLSRYHIVREASDLRLKRTKNIIKLHGSLRNVEQRAQFKFKFDGDPHKQYVIAKEDYDTYRDKHEAFTQLMRISLLQESFCLIGFSGVDPNFKAWINWVKDILHKAAIKRNKHDQYKIYLIDVGSGDLTADQELFYENHSIARIPLLDPKVQEFLHRELGEGLRITDIRTALNGFFAFLTNNGDVQPDVFQLDLSDETRIKKLWRDIKIEDIEREPDVVSMQEGLADLEALDGKIWIANPNHGNSFSQFMLLNYVNHGKWLLFFTEQDKEHILKRLVILALKEYNVPIRNMLGDDVRDTLTSVPELAHKLQPLISRNASLDVENDQPFSPYDRILQFAYSFQFTELRTHLDSWKPLGREKLQKAGFMAFFDSKKTSSILKDDLELEVGFSDEEKLYGYELLSFLISSYKRPVDKRISRIIRNYEKAGFQPFHEKLKYLEDQVSKNTETLAPFGEGRYSINRTIFLNQHSKQESSVRYLMMLAESGFQLKLNNTFWRPVDKWYSIHAEGFEYYPYAFLFYSLQFGDEKFLKRIGQDYAFNTKIQKVLPNITLSLLKAYPHSPSNYGKNMLLFLSRVIIAVEPDNWQVQCLKIWKQQLKEKLVFNDPRRYAHLNFFVNAIQLVTEKKILLQIAKDCLIQIQTGDSTQAISYLYYLNRNVHYKNLNANSLGSELSRIINSVIGLITKENDSVIFALGNIYGLLRVSQKSRIVRALRNFDFGGVENPRSWHIYWFFSHGDSVLQERIKLAILSTPSIWHTGIKGDSKSVDWDNLIELSHLTYSIANPTGVIWNKEEIDSLYSALKKELHDVKLWTEQREFKFDFTGVLHEMLWFVQTFEMELVDQPDIIQTFEDVTRLYQSDRNYSQLEQGLVSEDHSTVVLALGELAWMVYNNQEHNEPLCIVFYKVLLRSDPALEAAIGYLASWSKILLGQKPNTFFCKLYIDVLIRYRNQPLRNVDQAFIVENLVTIAYHLHLNGFDNDDVKWWLEQGRISVYNNVKQFFFQMNNNITE